MNVRLALVADHERMLELWERSVRATHDFLEERDIVTLRPLVAMELASQTIDWWVLESAGDVAGFLGFANDSIEGLFLAPDQRGRGGGRLLVEHAQQLASGPLAVDVNEQNDAALEFYKALGFVVTGRSPTDGGGRPFPIVHTKRTR